MWRPAPPGWPDGSHVRAWRVRSAMASRQSARDQALHGRPTDPSPHDGEARARARKLDRIRGGACVGSNMWWWREDDTTIDFDRTLRRTVGVRPLKTSVWRCGASDIRTPRPAKRASSPRAKVVSGTAHLALCFGAAPPPPPRRHPAPFCHPFSDHLPRTRTTCADDNGGAEYRMRVRMFF